jgi:hypothetical protein
MLRVFKNRVLRKLLGPKWRDVTGDYVMKSFIYCSSHQILQQNSFRLLTESRNPDNSALKREWFQDPKFGRL